jgi:cyanophycinase
MKRTKKPSTKTARTSSLAHATATRATAARAILTRTPPRRGPAPARPAHRPAARPASRHRHAASTKSRAISGTGTLISVGGREDKEAARVILKEIADRTGSGKLIIATVASEVADELWADYKAIFTNLGVKSIEHLTLTQPDQARTMDVKKLFHGASTVFFTGGDQLKITTKLGGSPIIDGVFQLYRAGGTVAGTSAGAAVMGKTMLVGGENVESHKVGNWMMAPGLGFLENMLIDQHFAQRGRIGRLLGAVALNPGVLGIGIDEDTAIVVEKDQFRVIGTNAVYVVDGRTVTYTNISEASADNTMSMHGVSLHILATGEVFNLSERIPYRLADVRV